MNDDMDVLKTDYLLEDLKSFMSDMNIEHFPNAPGLRFNTVFCKMQRGWNSYWLEDKATQAHIMFVPELQHVFNM